MSTAARIKLFSPYEIDVFHIVQRLRCNVLDQLPSQTCEMPFAVLALEREIWNIDAIFYVMSDLHGIRVEWCENTQANLLLKRSNGRNENLLPIVIVLEYMPHQYAGSVRPVGAQVDDLIGKGRLAASSPM